MVQYVVKYTVVGTGEQQAGPYRTATIAIEHMDDIRSYEGVVDCRLVPIEVPEQPRKPR